MPDPRVSLKNPWIAGVLSFLIPGAGQLYQGRLFKSAVFFFCILGLYSTGMLMADWKAVYIHRPGNRQPQGKAHTLQFLAQAGVGLPAVCALVQNRRFYSPENQETDSLNAPLTASFDGEYRPNDGAAEVPIQGTIELAPTEGRFGKSVEGRFYGHDRDGHEVELQLGESFELEEPINASRGRDLEVDVVKAQGDSLQVIGKLDGDIPRPFYDWFVVPVKTEQERRMHQRLGKFHELAMVFTWVAGLLNILAVWDALEGPAYGYGDELNESAPDEKQRASGTAKPERATAPV
ncbi:MAG: DUF6677 family protein [Planctomycetaceae bacterium]